MKKYDIGLVVVIVSAYLVFFLILLAIVFAQDYEWLIIPVVMVPIIVVALFGLTFDNRKENPK